MAKELNRRLLSRTLAYARPHFKLLVLAALCTFSLALISPLRPRMIQYAIDHFVAVSDPVGLWNYATLVALVLFTESLLQYGSSLWGNTLGQKVIHDIRIEVFSKLLNFRTSFFDKTPVGTLVTRTVSDIQNIADVFGQGLIEMVSDLLKVLIIVIFMFYLDVKLSLMALSTIPLLILATHWFRIAVRQAFNDVRNQVAKLNAFVQEHITGMAVVQAFAMEGRVTEEFDAINKLHRDANIRSVWHYSVFFPIVEILSAVSVGLLVWWGAGEALAGETTVGTIIAFIMYIQILFKPIRQLADRFNTIQMSLICSERVFRLIDEEAEYEEDLGNNEQHLLGNIEFVDVQFGYNQDNPIISNLNLKIRAGERIAIVGSTGSGKSTLVSLISRFYTLNSGKILIDGVDIRDIKLSSLRKQIVWVPQEVFLFPGTVFENISMGNEAITHEQVMNAVTQIAADDLIKNLPGGLDFKVNERGVLLSAGQRQLISFLRAWVTDPQILILDEATANIDPETERFITKATREITKDRTSIIIAHRLQTIMHADSIVVMQDGKIIESGTMEQLIAADGHFAGLWRAQQSEN
jgi:ATP-binding cassette subfamily B multidrug efflux pump